jgi:hypothetical protein
MGHRPRRRFFTAAKSAEIWARPTTVIRSLGMPARKVPFTRLTKIWLPNRPPRTLNL